MTCPSFIIIASRSFPKVSGDCVLQDKIVLLFWLLFLLLSYHYNTVLYALFPACNQVSLPKLVERQCDVQPDPFLLPQIPLLHKKN